MIGEERERKIKAKFPGKAVGAAKNPAVLR